MIELYDKETHTYIGTISDEELQFLIDNLEEENLIDKDYYLNRATLEFLKERGISAHLAKLLEDAMGDRDEIEIIYKEDLQKEIE
jgi:hypothetical protein